MPTNFLQFNPNLTNAESDSQYQADPLRQNGAPVTAICPSNLFNKAMYQSSTFTAALAQALSNKGYSVLDSNYANLVAMFANIRTNADVVTLLTTVAYSPSLVFNALLSNGFQVTLTGDVTSSALQNPVNGQVYNFVITQDAAGNHAFTWPANFVGGGAVNPQANRNSVQSFIWVASLNVALAASPLVSAGLVTTTVLNIAASGNVSSGYQPLYEVVNAGGGAITRTLFDATLSAGRVVYIKKNDVTLNPVVVQAMAGQSVDGAANISITNPKAGVMLVNDGAGTWYLFATFTPGSIVAPVAPPPTSAMMNIGASGNVSNAYLTLYENVNAAGGAITRTLYDASTQPAGRMVNIKKVDTSANPVTIQGPGGQTIDGQASFVLTAPYSSYELSNDGAGHWYVF